MTDDQCSEGRGAQDAEIRLKVLKVLFGDLDVSEFIGIIRVCIVKQVVNVFAVAVQVKTLLAFDRMMLGDGKGTFCIKDRGIKREVEGPVRNHLF